jgi:UDP-glucuronate decarboxylase
MHEKLRFSCTSTLKILLTGGTGFFGKALLKHWAAALPQLGCDFQVTVLTRKPELFLASYPNYRESSWLQFHKGDINDPQSLPRSDGFTHILHAAADSTYGPTHQPLDRFRQIVDGTRNLLQYATYKRISRFLYISSGAVYGVQPPDLDTIKEDWPSSPDLTNPANAYGLAKRAAEHLCHLYHTTHGIEVVVARCFAFVGPDLPLNVHFAIGNFIRDALYHGQISIAGDGTPIRSYLDQADLSLWLTVLLLHGHNGETYNVGSDEAISISQLAYLIRDILSPNKPVILLGSSQSSIGRNRYVPSILKVKEQHGLKVQIPLATAIQRTADSHLR